MPRVALATASAARHLDDDLPLLTRALRALGAEVTVADWDDASVDWSAADVVVVRSTWDYTTRLGEFIRWAERVSASTRLDNPLEVIRWNTDKHYLADLADAGVPVVATSYVEPGGEAALPDADEVVVKPAVSAGARDTARYRTDGPQARQAALAHVRRITAAGRTALVQPYLAGIDAHGETAVVVVGGTVSHVLVKEPMLEVGSAARSGRTAAERIAPRAPSAAELAVAGAAVSAARDLLGTGPLLYTRVDLIPGPDGAPRLLELELTEPSLFHTHAPGSAERFARTVLEALQ